MVKIAANGSLSLNIFENWTDKHPSAVLSVCYAISTPPQEVNYLIRFFVSLFSEAVCLLIILSRIIFSHDAS